MTYSHLPAVGAEPLPDLHWRWTRACSSRHGSGIHVVFVHRWGGGSFDGVVEEFLNPANRASSHLVYAGEQGRDKGRCTQMVRYGDKAWTEANFNPIGVSIESADAIWLGHDPVGFARLARMVAFLCHDFALPPAWVGAAGLVRGEHGFARHADGGSAAGGHTACPTTDIPLWRQFAARVRAEHHHGGFRAEWGHR